MSTESALLAGVLTKASAGALSTGKVHHDVEVRYTNPLAGAGSGRLSLSPPGAQAQTSEVQLARARTSLVSTAALAAAGPGRGSIPHAGGAGSSPARSRESFGVSPQA